VDLRRSGALLDLGDLAAGNGSEPLTVGAMAIWFTPDHGAVVDLAPIEPRALPAPRPAPVRVLPPERSLDPGLAAAPAEVRERLAEQHVVHVDGPDAAVAGVLSALARDGSDPEESVVALDVRGTSLSDILQTLFELLCLSPPASVASSDELRAGLGAVRSLVLLRDATLTVSETLTLGDTLRGCRVVLGHDGERWLEEAIVPLDVPRDTPEAVARRVASLRPDETRALELLVAAGGDPIHEDVVRAALESADAEAFLRTLEELGLIERDGVWNRPGSSVLRSVPDGLRQERWAGPLASALAAWAHGAREVEGTWSRGPGAWRRAHAWLLRDASNDAHRSARRLQEDVALARRWGAWRAMLLDIVEYAEARGDTAARAWALHQLGSRALCLGDRMAARACLAEARDLRWRTGDRAGAAVTQHNLTLATASGDGQAPRRSWLSAWASRARGRRREPIG